MVFRYGRTYQFVPEPDEIILRDRAVWRFRAWRTYLDDACQYKNCLSDTEVTGYELLPAFLEARAMGILTGPRAVEAMLDKQLLALRFNSPPIAPKNIGVAAADALLGLTGPLPVTDMPKDDRRIFPSLFASKVDCSECRNKPFAEYYRPRSCGNFPLTDELVQWCMYSFTWTVMLSTTMTVRHNTWPTSAVPFVDRGYGVPCLVPGSADVTIWTMPQNVSICVRGCGLPRSTVQMTKYVLENVSSVLGVDMKAVQTSLVVDVEHRVGTCMYSRHGKNMFFHCMCKVCATLPAARTSPYAVEPAYAQRARLLLL